MAFDRELDISSSYYDICFYRTNVKNLNNVRNKIPTFKLYNIMRYLSLYYLIIKK